VSRWKERNCWSPPGDPGEQPGTARTGGVGRERVLTPDEVMDGGELMLPVDLIRPYAMRPVTTQPEDPGSQWPVCGSTGCVAGWGAILAAPPGSFIRGSRIFLPGGEET